jgi:hypothetical protein
MGVVGSAIVLEAGQIVSACFWLRPRPRTLPRRTRRKVERGVDRAVDNTGLEANIRITKGYRGGHDAILVHVSDSIYNEA